MNKPDIQKELEEAYSRGYREGRLGGPLCAVNTFGRHSELKKEWRRGYEDGKKEREQGAPQ